MAKSGVWPGGPWLSSRRQACAVPGEAFSCALLTLEMVAGTHTLSAHDQVPPPCTSGGHDHQSPLLPDGHSAKGTVSLLKLCCRPAGVLPCGVSLGHSTPWRVPPPAGLCPRSAVGTGGATEAELPGNWPQGCNLDGGGGHRPQPRGSQATEGGKDPGNRQPWGKGHSSCTCAQLPCRQMLGDESASAGPPCLACRRS